MQRLTRGGAAEEEEEEEGALASALVAVDRQDTPSHDSVRRSWRPRLRAPASAVHIISISGHSLLGDGLPGASVTATCAAGGVRVTGSHGRSCAVTVTVGRSSAARGSPKVRGYPRQAQLSLSLA